MAVWPYNTKLWKSIRKTKLYRDPICQQCEADGRTEAATDVDHVLAISKGGEPWSMSNLRSLCHSCHSRKTRHVDQLGKAAVPRRAIKGCGTDGLPLDPEHHWNKKISQS